MLTRRTFLNTTLNTGAAALATRLFAAPADATKPNAELANLGGVALREAKKLKASYCDIRIIRTRQQFLNIRLNPERGTGKTLEVPGVGDGGSFGFGVRVIVDGAWGFAASPLVKPEEIARIIAEMLDTVGLKGTEDKMPSDLSGGMKKRAAIARALVIEPQLILYDEPTSELDPLSSVVIGEEILKLQRRIQVTSLVVSHDRDLAFGVADRIAVINEGRILTIGTPEEVKRFNDPLVQSFLHADFKREPQSKSL